MALYTVRDILQRRKKMKKSLLVASLAVISANVLGMSPFENNNQNGNNHWHTLTPNSSPKNDSDSIKQIQESVQNFLNGDLSVNETKKLVNMMYTQISATSTKIQDHVQDFLNGDLTEKKTNELVNMMYTQITATEKNQELKQHIANLEEQNKQNAQLISKKNAEILRLNQQNQQIISSGFALNESIVNLLNQSRRKIAEKDDRISKLNERIAQFRFDNQQLVSDNKGLNSINQQLWLNNQNLRHNLNSTQRIIRNGAYQVLRKGSMHITESALLNFAIHLYNSSNKTDGTISELSDENTMEHDIGLQSPEKRYVTETTISQTTTNKQTISTEKLKEKLKLPEYPEGYEKDFFDAIEKDFNIDIATAKNIIARWRILELEAFKSVEGLTEEKLNEWRSSSNKLVQSKDPIFKDLMTKIKYKKNELYSEYKEVSNKGNIRNLIIYHDSMLIRFDDSCSFLYMAAIYCNYKSKEVLSWLENYDLGKRVYITKEKREDVISQIVEGKQFEEIKETYPKLSKQMYGRYVTYVEYWFSFSEQELFKKKINDKEFNEEFKDKHFAIDVEALVDLIKSGRSNFIKQHKNKGYQHYQDIASVWEILAAKNFERPEWCNGHAISKEKIEANKKRSESNMITKNDIKVVRNYLKFIDKNLPGTNTPRPNKKQNVIFLYKWKLDTYNGYDKDFKELIRGTDSEFKANAVYKEVQNYFDLNCRDIRRIFEPYRGETGNLEELRDNIKEYHNIPAKDITAEVDAKIRKYEEKYNILNVLNAVRTGKEIDPEAQFASQKIVRDLWEMGFSYERVVELLGLKDDFADYRSTVEKQAESSSSSSTAQTRKRKADSDDKSTKKRNKWK
jgi:hypothetical protein